MSVSINHVHREDNQAADALANRAIDCEPWQGLPAEGDMLADFRYELPLQSSLSRIKAKVCAIQRYTFATNSPGLLLWGQKQRSFTF